MNANKFCDFLEDILVKNQALYITKKNTPYRFKGWNKKSLIFKTKNTKKYIDKDVLISAFKDGGSIDRDWIKENFGKKYNCEIYVLNKLIQLPTHLKQ